MPTGSLPSGSSAKFSASKCAIHIYLNVGLVKAVHSAPLAALSQHRLKSKDQQIHGVRPPAVRIVGPYVRELSGSGDGARKLVAGQAQQPELETLAQQFAISDIDLLMCVGARRTYE